ncbi:MAG: N-acetyltransferase [Lewinellaceae bacterium]|nr:N-acetyltransferase [Phaeodactylibacter sp.]MCB9346000.1 N-acetyltransferase [Lewinellaceae bacterium]
MKVKIRAEEPRDEAMIRQVNDEAFEQQNEGRLVDALRAMPDYIGGLSLVAEAEGRIVGHILFSPVEIRHKEVVHHAIALAPMAVLPAYQSRGIGSLLVEEGLRRARQMGYGAVIVLGHEWFYPRFGFRPASHWNIRCPFPVPEAAFMAIELRKDALKEVKGRVKYSRPFDEV